MGFEAAVLLQLLWCLLQDEVWYDHWDWVEGQFYYVKTYIPPDNFEAMRAKHFEQPPTSREDLLHKLKNVTPHTSRILLPVTIKDVYEGNKFDDTFKITSVSYKQLQDFDWEEILDFAQDVTAVWQALICV